MAVATIINVWDTAITINNDQVVGILLKVAPPRRPAFQAELEQRISRLEVHNLRPGAVIQVMCDPASQAVALVRSSAFSHS